MCVCVCVCVEGEMVAIIIIYYSPDYITVVVCLPQYDATCFTSSYPQWHSENPSQEILRKLILLLL